MTASTPAITKKIRELVRLELDQLARIRDEIRLKAHLASMEGRSAWADLEKQFEQLEERFGREGDHIVGRTRQIAAEVQAAFLVFKRTLVNERSTDPALPTAADLGSRRVAPTRARPRDNVPDRSTTTS